MLLDRLGITVALDVGANVGQYALELREHGFHGEIISFEPLSSAFSSLREAALSDPGWRTHNIALGEASSKAIINVTSNLASSSLLPLVEGQRALAPEIVVAGQEEVDVRPLDEIEMSRDAQLLLKLDVQGYEDRVLRGAGETLRSVEIVECELSIVAFYERQLKLGAMLSMLGERGFELVDLEPGQRGSDGSIAYLDALLIRSPAQN
jgi:FkbM family methyltransferase